jgi:predicted ATPase
VRGLPTRHFPRTKRSLPQAGATTFPGVTFETMNEQLIVKNFGPIKDATVDFKKVTVFIGPTGGGKRTLAKLAAIFNGGNVVLEQDNLNIDKAMVDYGLNNYNKINYSITWKKSTGNSITINNKTSIEFTITDTEVDKDVTKESLDRFFDTFIKSKNIDFLLKNLTKKERDKFKSNFIQKLKNDNIKFTYQKEFSKNKATYIPAERIFIPAIEYSWPGLMRDDIGLPKILLDFANAFSLSRKEVSEISIPFLNIKYIHFDGKDFVIIPGREEPLALLEAASGIQSVTPLIILLEHIREKKSQIQNFIVEEPELNLYPTAQQGLLNWLVSKCTTDGNELTITTHSPYILASCNLLMEAYKVWQDRPELESEIEKIVPRTSWINPEEFAAYYVADGTVRSIQDERTDLIGGNELDAVSGHISDAFRSLLRLKKQPA